MASLLDRFNDTSLPASEFHHRQHVEVAWMFVRDYGMPAALDAFSTALKRFAVAKGATGLYHQTITWAFLLIIAERRARCHAQDFDAFAAANPDVLAWKPSILDRYYSREIIVSDLARKTFLMPDRV